MKHCRRHRQTETGDADQRRPTMFEDEIIRIGREWPREEFASLGSPEAWHEQVRQCSRDLLSRSTDPRPEMSLYGGNERERPEIFSSSMRSRQRWHGSSWAVPAGCSGSSPLESAGRLSGVPVCGAGAADSTLLNSIAASGVELSLSGFQCSA